MLVFRATLRATAFAFALGLTGCHSAFIDTTVSNRSAAPVTLIQVDYPSASFGTQTLAPSQDFHYRFKVLGSGPVKLTYTDTSGHEHKATGPALNESSDGPLQIVIAPDAVHFLPETFPSK